MFNCSAIWFILDVIIKGNEKKIVFSLLFFIVFVATCLPCNNLLVTVTNINLLLLSLDSFLNLLILWVVMYVELLIVDCCFQSPTGSTRSDAESVGVQSTSELPVTHQLSTRPSDLALPGTLRLRPGASHQRHHRTPTHRQAGTLAPAAGQEPRRQGR